MKFATNIIALFLSIVAFGCGEKENYGVYNIMISPTISRASELNFEAGDQVGLSIYKSNALYQNNVPMTYSANYFLASDLHWYDQYLEKSSLIAYYPYSSAGVPNELSLLLDQSLGYEKCDLMCAVRSDILPTANAVEMIFKRLLSKLSISITNQASANVEDVYVCGSVTEANLNILKQSIEVKDSSPAKDIKAYDFGRNNLSYQAIIVPQTAALSLKVIMDDGVEHELPLMSIPFLSGFQYAISAKITNSSINIAISGDIVGWEDGGNLSQDSSIEYMGEKYGTIKIYDRIWMAESLRFIPNSEAIGDGVWYPHKNGVASNDIEDVKKYGMFYSYHTALDLCPVGWRIPTENDFNSLVANINPPFAAYIPFSGIYIPMQDEYITNVGAIMGSASQVDGFHKCLSYELGETPRVVSYSVNNGLPLRCVRSI